MATTTQNRTSSEQTTTRTNGQKPSVLEQVIANWERKTPGEKVSSMKTGLEQQVKLIEQVLPPRWRGHGNRLISRALLTFSRKPELMKCNPKSFLQCVVEAAEMGLMVDGKLGYAVPHKGQAVFYPSYKGLVAVARRSTIIADVFSEIVREGDEFSYSVEDGHQRLHHKPRPNSTGKPIAVYAVFVLPSNLRKIVVLNMEHVNKVRARSASGSRGSGPWITDTDEMIKKTVVKNGMKLYEDDPDISMALDRDDKADADLIDETWKEINNREPAEFTPAAPVDSEPEPPQEYEPDPAPPDGPSVDWSQKLDEELTAATTKGQVDSVWDKAKALIAENKITSEVFQWVKGRCKTEAKRITANAAKEMPREAGVEDDEMAAGL